MTGGLAPIALFVYRRPRHTRNVLTSLAANVDAGNSALHVFCDGAKPQASAGDIADIKEVRRIVRAEDRFKEIVIVEREANVGLANSIISGVSEVVGRYGSVIVVEDDLLLSRYFLKYMNDSLIRYREDHRVGQIGACNFFACGSRYPRSFFAPMPDCWGWATWSDRWHAFESDGAQLLQRLVDAGLLHRFNVEGAYPMDEMLRMQIEGKVDSWAIRWQAVCVLRDWWTLYPNRSMSNHIESLRNTHGAVNRLPPLETDDISYETIPVGENPLIMRAMKRGYAGLSNTDGTLNLRATRAWLRHLAPRWALKTWRRGRGRS